MRNGGESGRGRRGEESHRFTLDVPGEDTNMLLEEDKKGDDGKDSVQLQVVSELGTSPCLTAA